MPGASLKFDDLELDLGSYQLRRNGSAVKLEKIPMELLILLASRNGQLVSREEIVEKLWGKDVFVDSAHGVNTAIRKIRNALQDDPEKPRFIETVVGKGYRFVAPLVPALQEVPPPALREARPRSRSFLLISACLIGVISVGAYWGLRYFWPVGPVQGGRTMLAVLPFENLTGDPNQEYFSDGLTEEMITQLGRLDPRQLGVIARTSAMSYKHSTKAVDQIGRELGVNYILEGSARREGGRLRVTAQLIQVRDQTHVWAAEYDREMQSVLQVQSEVANAIGNEVRLKLAPEQRARAGNAQAVNPEAYEAYLKGRYFIEKWTEEGTRVGREYFEQAIQKDPSYALAYAGLADSYVWGRAGLPPEEALQRARAAAIKALELDDTLGEPHAALGQIKFVKDWDWAAAEAQFKRAIDLNPNDANALHMYSHYLLSMGRMKESFEVSRRALEHDPVSPTMQLHLGFHYLTARQYDLAIPQYLKVLQADPSLADAHNQLAVAYRQKGMLDQSVAEYLQVETLLGMTPEQISELKSAYARSGIRAFWLTVLEFTESSGESRISPYQMASYYAILNKKDESFEWLEKAYNAHDAGLVAIKTDSDFDNLHLDSRFADLLLRMRLPN
ncbi:MAG TPA: winged helix-turn-helix domain-containing protein [Candidatus Sulfotelmatobacter sp.]|nr:winged helix-turn-helix domain-containing protein [Candidatus Sulfotelmatobacter sp.]